MSLEEIVQALMAQKKGILAADESVATATKRFEALGIESTAESRRAYREMLVTTPSFGEFVSGVILFDETFTQAASTGELFPQFLEKRGIIPGVKVDDGLLPLPSAAGEDVGEVITDGIETLPARLTDYAKLGARFTKWRAVIRIHEFDLPTDKGITENMKLLSTYALIAVQHGLVPILEPEVLMEGKHTAERAEQIMTRTLFSLFKLLDANGVPDAQIIIKSSMAVAGRGSEVQASPEEVAERTVRALRATVPPGVGGVVFLSGGQTPQEACANLNAVARLAPHPWPITFSFSRALQEPALAAWKGQNANVPDAQAAFLHRLELASLAREGGYAPSLEN